MATTQAALEDVVAPRAPRRGRRARLWSRVRDGVYSAIGPADYAATRRYIFQRWAVALIILSTLPIQEMRIPGWPAVLAGCLAASSYNVFFAYLVFRRNRLFAARALGLLCDAVVLMGASLYVFREMAAVNSESSIWLVFVVYVVTGGFTLAPVGSIFFTILWTAWFALGTLLYFEPGSLYREELPIRLVFLAMIGFLALAMAAELQKRRERLEQQNRQTMEMLAKLVEARDSDAGGHLYRIQHFSRALARHVGLSAREADEIASASVIHDVGKANLPDNVLKKTGPLNPDEWRVMQDHTVMGDALLTENSDFELARQVARWHHEHWDGTGYPDGLRGEEIPLAARIVAVADVYDALISKRPYKDAWPARDAIKELQRMAGSHLDPELVRAFVELWQTGLIDRLRLAMGRDGHDHAEPPARAA